MANETILVVDDAAVTLKLIANLLRSEGYKVQIASNAEQALSTLRMLRPDLVLIDIHLPGIDGFELARRIKQDILLQNTVIVGMTASSRAGIEQEASDAGCDGFIAKPIAPQLLRVLIPQYLKHEVPLETRDEPRELPGLAAGFSFSGPEMEGMRRAFLEEAIRQSRQMVSSLDSSFDESSAGRLLHQWVGAAGLFGYTAIASLALKVEALLNSPHREINYLRESLSDLVRAFDELIEDVNAPLPDSVAQGLTGKRIALVGFAEAEADRLCVALARIGAKPRSFAIGEPPDSNSIRDCEAVMVHVRPETAEAQLLSPAFTAPVGIPLVLVGTRENLFALAPSVQSRAQEFLIDGWQSEEALMRLHFALSRAATPAATASSGVELPSAAAPAAAPLASPSFNAHPEILVADDSLTIQTLLRCVLENHSMKCRIADTGTDALRMLRERLPDVAVLDVNMPGLDGFEVLMAIRRDKFPVRVILLTARQTESDILRGFNLGADDYIVKPFNPLELVARVKRLL